MKFKFLFCFVLALLPAISSAQPIPGSCKGPFLDPVLQFTEFNGERNGTGTIGRFQFHSKVTFDPINTPSTLTILYYEMKNGNSWDVVWSSSCYPAFEPTPFQQTTWGDIINKPHTWEDLDPPFCDATEVIRLRTWTVDDFGDFWENTSNEVTVNLTTVIGLADDFFCSTPVSGNVPVDPNLTDVTVLPNAFGSWQATATFSSDVAKDGDSCSVTLFHVARINLALPGEDPIWWDLPTQVGATRVFTDPVNNHVLTFGDGTAGDPGFWPSEVNIRFLLKVDYPNATYTADLTAWSNEHTTTWGF